MKIFGRILLVVLATTILNSLISSSVDAYWSKKITLNGGGQAAAVGDIDNDGDIDIFAGLNGYWRNDGLGDFTGASIGGLSGVSNNVNPSLGDVNNDGILDIFMPGGQLWVSSGVLSYNYRPIAGGSFAIMSFMFDFNNDNLLDIYTTHRTVINRLFRNTGTGFVANNIAGDTGNVGYYSDATYLDFNNDGLQDIYVVGDSMPNNRLWRNTGTGFVAANIPGDVGGLGAVALDYNNDGFDDLYVANGGNNRLWKSTGTGFVAANISGDTTAGTKFGVDTGDYNNDGLVDIYLSEVNPIIIWVNNGDETFTRVNGPAISQTFMDVEVEDYNNDGFDDLYLHDFYKGELWLWVNDLFVTINAPTKILNNSITDTTIVVTGAAGLFATGVSIDPSSTASASNLSCTQITSTRVECTVQIDSSGKLVIRAIDKALSQVKKTELNYIIDYVAPNIPSINVNTQSPYSLHSPQISFGSTDNIGMNYCTLQYREDDTFTGSASGSIVTINPAVSPLVVNLDPDEILHTIIVGCYDLAGNYSENLIKFPPIVSFTTPTTISNVSIEDALVTITSPQGNDLNNIQITSTISPTPTITNCIGSGNDLVTPYASPVVCEVHGISQSGSITVTAQDAVTLAVGENSNSFIIDQISPIGVMTSATLISYTGITTTIEITDDVLIYATGITISGATTAAYSNFSCTQINNTTVSCDIQINNDGDLVVQVADFAGNIVSVIQTGYVVDTVYPTIVITDDTSNIPTISDTIIVNTSDDILLQTGSLLYGYSTDAICDATDSYIDSYQSGSGIIINNETHNDEYVCFQAIDHVGNTTYVGGTNSLQIDITAPSISFVSGANMTWQVNTTFVDPGYTVSDNFTPSGSIITTVSGSVNTSIFATYPIVYTITDALGNTRNVTRNVTVVDTIAPVLTGIYNHTISLFDTYTGMNDYSVSDNYRPLTGITVTISGTVNTGVVGTYNLLYTATDMSGNYSTFIRSVFVIDPIPPVITIVNNVNNSANTGDTILVNVSDDKALQTGTLLYGFSTDAICDATDTYTIPYNSGTGFLINTETHNGEYICFQASDFGVNTVYLGTNNVLNIDVTPPTISVTPWTGYHTVGNLVITGTGEVGAVITVYNASGAALCSTTINTGGVYSCGPLGLGNGVHNVSVVGVDGLGNTTIPIAMSVSIDTTAPVITLIGNNEIRVPLGGEYVESGANGMDNIDGDISGNIVISGSVNTGVAGSYEITYNVIDGAGNVAITVIRTVVVYNPAVIGYAGGGGTSNGSTSTNTTPTNTNNQGNTVEPGVPTSAITTLYNSGIEEGKCYVRGTGTTVYQGNNVSMDFRKAHQMMYSYGLTKWKGTSDYRPEDGITREEAARFMVEYAKNVLCREKVNEYSNTFSDIGKADGSLQKYIKESYEYGIFKGAKGEFKPKSKITTDELSAVIVRMVTNEFMEELGVDWAKLYREKLGNYAQTSVLNIVRSNIAEVMYDVYRNNEYEWKPVGYVIK